MKQKSSQKFEVNFIYFFLLGLCLTQLALIPPLVHLKGLEVSYAFGDEVEIEAAKFLMKQLGDPNPRIASEAAKKLSVYSYQDVTHALLTTIMREVAKPSPNSFILSESIASLEELLTLQDKPKLVELTELWNAKTATFSLLPWFKFVDPRVKTLEAHALTRNAALPEFPKPKLELFKSILEKNGLTDSDSPEAILLKGTSSLLTDEVRKSEAKDDDFTISGRDHEADNVIDGLVRLKGKNPFLIGPAGAGKTTIAMRVAQKLLKNDFPIAEGAYMKALSHAEIIETTPARISRLAKADTDSAQATAIEVYFEAINQVQKKLNKPIVLYIDEIHTLKKSQIEAMKRYMDSLNDGIMLIGSTTSKEFSQTFKDNEAFRRRVFQTPVEEFTVEQVLSSVNEPKGWLSRIESNYGVQFSQEALELVIKNSTVLLPDSGRFDGSIKTMQDIAISIIRGATGSRTIGEEQVYAFIQKKTGFPVNPHNGSEFARYLKDLELGLNEEVIGQSKMVKDVVDQWAAVLQDSDRGVRVVVEAGPTGVGKTELGKAFAKKVFKNPKAYFEIDANLYKTGGYAMNSLFGAPNGINSSDTTSGTLMDWLDDPAGGKFGGMILINEGERASEDFWERLMEFFDTAQIYGADGKVRRAVKHMVVITSNRADSLAFPGSIDKWTDKEIIARTTELGSDEVKGFFIRTISGKDDFKLPLPVLNRVDKYTVAKPILRSEALEIVNKIAAKFKEKTYKDLKIHVEIEAELLEHLVSSVYNIRDGARPIVRQVEDYLKQARVEGLGRWDTPREGELYLGLSQPKLPGGVPAILIHTSASAAGEHFLLDLPKLKIQDPLDDPEFLAKLRNLKAKLKERIFGQDEMLNSISQAVISHQANPEQSGRALSLMIVGSTGTGKTETGKAIAEALYGNAKRFTVIPLGKIIYEGELNNIFGSPAGHVGSLEEKLFEKFLRENPNGGVGIFDEASNMGGKEHAQKDALFKKFYDVVEDGQWTSPATNETYDLSKYIFLFTGNDGEKLVAGMSSDDLRLSAWNRSKSRESVRALLRDSGVPEAFLGRMADVILMRPLMRAETARIADKLLKPVFEGFKARNVDVSYSDDFVEKFANTFFTQDEGGRSLRKVAETRVQALLTSAFMEIRIDAKADPSKSMKFVISVEDNGIPRPFSRKNDPDRVVDLTVQAYQDGVLIHEAKENVTEFAAEQMKPQAAQAIVIAFHEAGHAVANEAAFTNETLAYLTILPGKTKSLSFLGYARYEQDKNLLGKNPDRKSVVETMAKQYGGRIAQELAGFPADAGWAQDLKQMREYGTRALTEWGLDDELRNIAHGPGGKPQYTARQNELISQKLEELMNEAEKTAKERLINHWEEVRLTVIELMKKGSITASEFSDVKMRAVAKTSRQYELDPVKKRIRLKRTLLPVILGMNGCNKILEGK